VVEESTKMDVEKDWYSAINVSTRIESEIKTSNTVKPVLRTFEFNLVFTTEL
jgi:hypothetical protein